MMTKLVEIYRRDLSDTLAQVSMTKVHEDRHYLLGIISQCHGVILEHKASECDEQDAYGRICDILIDA